MAKENLSGTPGTRANVADLSLITANQQKGAICVLAALKRGRNGEFYKIGNDTLKKRELGGLILNNDDSLLIKLALDAGALLYIGRLFHYTDIDDAGTIEGDKASVVIASTVAETLAIGSIDITGGSADPGVNKIDTIEVNAVDILGGVAEDWITSNAQTAINVAAAITGAASVPNYNAVAVGNKVNITADAGSGATPNGFLVTGTVSGDATIGNAVNMAGGVAAGAINITIEAEEVGDGYNLSTIQTQAAKSKKVGYVDFLVNLTDSDVEVVLRDVNQTDVAAADITNLNSRLKGVGAQVVVSAITGSIPVGTGTLLGGAQDLSLIDEADYTGSVISKAGIHVFDEVTDSMRLFNLNKAVPEVDQAFTDYCEARKDMRCAIRTPFGLTVSALGDYRNGTGVYTHAAIDSLYTDLWYSDAEITDPSDINIKDKLITALAFKLAGRSIKDRKEGEWLSDSGNQSPFSYNRVNKVPLNLISPVYNASYGDIYEDGVNAIVKHPTYGVVPWGNRSLYKDTTSLLSKMNIADGAVYISRVLIALASGSNFAPNDFQMFNELYRRVRPFFVDLVKGRAIQGDDGPLSGEGVWWHWFGDQFATTPADLSFNEASDIDVGKYRTRFAYKPIASNEYIAIDVSPADSATILNISVLETL